MLWVMSQSSPKTVRQRGDFTSFVVTLLRSGCWPQCSRARCPSYRFSRPLAAFAPLADLVHCCSMAQGLSWVPISLLCPKLSSRVAWDFSIFDTMSRSKGNKVVTVSRYVYPKHEIGAFSGNFFVFGNCNKKEKMT